MPAAEQLSSTLTSDAAASTARVHRRGLIARIILLSILFIAELLVLSIALDSSSLAGSHGLAALIGGWGPWIVRGIVGVSALYATFLWLAHRAELIQISRQLEDVPLGWGWFVCHVVAMAAFVALSARLYGSPLQAPSGASASNGLSAVWFLTGSVAIGFGACAMVPWKAWRKLLAAGGLLWIYAFAAIALACLAGNFTRKLWQPASALTFTLVRWILKPILPGLFSNADRLQLGTARFHVIIAPECSGLEGAGLILAFGLVWLLLFRRECRFPQSLALIPAGVALLFFLNAVRIAALIWIGDAGAWQIALGGFHSQAGWILFNAVAVGFCLTIRKVPWFTTSIARAGLSADGYASAGFPVSATAHIYNDANPAASRTTDNPTAAYLLPFLAILAAGMVATAASTGFEWLYTLRIIAAAAALWIFRKTYLGLEWRVSWVGIVSGLVVFLVWIGCDRLFGKSMVEQGTPAALAAASPLVRMAWISLRALAAIVTVPLAEELAFRGYLLRRFVSADFESVDPRSVTWLAVLGSSVVFGCLHGGLWIAGIIAGLVFAIVWKWRGSMGDAVVAHASANALLAAYVLAYGQWHLW